MNLTHELERAPRRRTRMMSVVLAAAATATVIQAAQADSAMSSLPLAAQTEVAPTDATTTLVDIPAATAQFFLGNDPFSPVRTQTVEVVTSPPGTTPQAGTEDDPCTSGAVVTCDGQSVRLIDVYDQSGANRAIVEIDGVAYDVESGQTFAVSYQVLSVEQSCATLLYGDDAFTLCEGQQILK